MPDFNRDFGITEPPVIVVQKTAFDQNAVAGEAALLQSKCPIFRRGIELVRPTFDHVETADGRLTTTAGLTPVTLPLLRQMLNRAAAWKKYDGRSKRLVDAAPPEEVANLILHRGDLGPFPSIAGVITTPTMRADGTLLMQPGYDEATRLLLFSEVSPARVPDCPTRSDAEFALSELQDLLCEFPFADDASKTVALSGLITPIVRAVMPVAPMHVASAPASSTGKSYLWDLASCIAVGRPCAVIALGRDEAETEKRLVGAVLRGHPMVSIDNANGPLEGDFLCQMIERPVLDVRRLGTSEGFTVENRITSYATGNNVRTRGDMVRRVVHCRLDANVERPDRRQFKARPDRLILDRRTHYVAQCLIIVRAYVMAGKPGRLDPIPSFEAWSDHVRSALVWLGCEDPLKTADAVRADDDREAEAAALFDAWPRGPAELESYTSAELIEQATASDRYGPRWRGLLEAVKAVGCDRRGNLSPQWLGYWLRDHRDRIIEGLKLTREGTEKRPRWAVRRTP